MSNIICQVRVNLETWVHNGIIDDIKFTANRDDCPYFVFNNKVPNDFEIDPGPEAYICINRSNAFGGQCPYCNGIQSTDNGVFVECHGLSKTK
jgi:hypothetical protein